MCAILADGLVGLAPAEPRPLAGKMANAAHQTARGFMTGAPYELAIVEFDDQGRSYVRAQMDGVAARIDALQEAGTDVILLVFVHGWKHDARSDDDNLTQFRIILTAAAKQEAASSGASARPVLGVFVGWRGLSEFGPVDAVADATFWGRQAAGQRVATGSVRELFARLRAYRNRRHDLGGSTVLAIAGHSFGGMIVLSALAQSLVEAAAAPAGMVVPGFADLVLLINPAVEAARYLPIYDIVQSAAFVARPTWQLPVFICAQAENDEPVGTWFPVGNLAHAAEQATIGALEKQCVTRALGFVTDFRTHALTGPAGGKPFGIAAVPPGTMYDNPFWVVGADRAVIDGHGGIWQRPFKLFLATILFQHLGATKDGGGGRAGGAGGAGPAGVPGGGGGGGGTPDDLGEYAKSIEGLFPD